jgi:hypothetical protein
MNDTMETEIEFEHYVTATREIVEEFRDDCLSTQPNCIRKRSRLVRHDHHKRQLSGIGCASAAIIF